MYLSVSVKVESPSRGFQMCGFHRQLQLQLQTVTELQFT